MSILPAHLKSRTGGPGWTGHLEKYFHLRKIERKPRSGKLMKFPLLSESGSLIEILRSIGNEFKFAWEIWPKPLIFRITKIGFGSDLGVHYWSTEGQVEPKILQRRTLRNWKNQSVLFLNFTILSRVWGWRGEGSARNTSGLWIIFY